MRNMELNEGHEQELMRLHDESGRLMIACQEMAEAARRLDAAFKDTIDANKQRLPMVSQSCAQILCR